MSESSPPTPCSEVTPREFFEWWFGEYANLLAAQGVELPAIPENCPPLPGDSVDVEMPGGGRRLFHLVMPRDSFERARMAIGWQESDDE